MAVSTQVSIRGLMTVVFAIAMQADGKILVGGGFTTLGGGGTGAATRNYVGRLNADGSLDTSFDPGANWTCLYALAVQTGWQDFGRGSFHQTGRWRLRHDRAQQYRPAQCRWQSQIRASIRGQWRWSGPLRCRRMARFWSGGTSPHWEAEARVRPRATMSVGSTPMAVWTRASIRGPMHWLYALAVQADGKILVGGGFTTLGGGGTGTTTRNYIGRLNADGSLDTSFDPGANGYIHVLGGAGGWQDSGRGRVHNPGRWRHRNDHTQPYRPA